MKLRKNIIHNIKFLEDKSIFGKRQSWQDENRIKWSAVVKKVISYFYRGGEEEMYWSVVTVIFGQIWFCICVGCCKRAREGTDKPGSVPPGPNIDLSLRRIGIFGAVFQMEEAATNALAGKVH